MELAEDAVTVVRRSPGKSAATKKATLTAEPVLAEVADTPKTPKTPKKVKKPAAAAPVDDLGDLDDYDGLELVTPKTTKTTTTPKSAKPIKTKLVAQVDEMDQEAEPVPTPKPKKAAVTATPKPKKAAVTVEEPPAPVATPKSKKAAVANTGLTTVSTVKGGISVPAQENHSLKLDLEKIPKLLECTNSYRVFCNIPPGLLTPAQEKAWNSGIKAAGLDSLKYAHKSLTTLHEQIRNRATQDLIITGWVPDPDSIQPVFGEGEAFTYVFMYPSNIKEYYNKLIEDGVEKTEALAEARAVRDAYNKHLDKFEHAFITALVKY